MTPKRPVVVLTGYGEFQTFTNNISEQVVRYLTEKGIPEVELHTDIITVAYDDVTRVSAELHSKHKPIVTIHCGLHYLADAVVLERKARNNGYDILDVKEQLPPGNCCYPQFRSEEACLETCLNVDDIISSINCPVPLTTSSDAGLYLCEFIYYNSLRRNPNTLFVHLPPLERGFKLEDLAEVVRQIVISAVEQCKNRLRNKDSL